VKGDRIIHPSPATDHDRSCSCYSAFGKISLM
jgi:hypothetical protein